MADPVHIDKDGEEVKTMINMDKCYRKCDRK